MMRDITKIQRQAHLTSELTSQKKKTNTAKLNIRHIGEDQRTTEQNLISRLRQTYKMLAYITFGMIVLPVARFMIRTILGRRELHEKECK